jgi:hypothetical protein
MAISCHCHESIVREHALGVFIEAFADVGLSHQGNHASTSAMARAIAFGGSWRAGGGYADVLAHDDPALLDVLTNPQELACRRQITFEQVES